jgi:hypothetical protein
MDFVYTRFKVLQQLSNQKWFSAQRTPLPIPDGDLTGKTVVVTGANVSDSLRSMGENGLKDNAREVSDLRQRNISRNLAWGV